MSDYTEINKAANGHAFPYTDYNIPKGYFAVAVTVHNVVIDYLLQGNLDQLNDARIVGRVERKDSSRGVAYKGTGLKGGYSSGQALTYNKAFSLLAS